MSGPGDPEDLEPGPTTGGTSAGLRGPAGDAATAPGPDVGTEPVRPGRRWYRSARFLVPAAVAVVIAIAVVTDLPTHSSRGAQVTTASAVVGEIRTSVHPCAYAVSQAFELLTGESHGTFSPADRARVPGYLRDDLQACSYASTSIFSLATITVPNSPAGRQLGTTVKTVLQWATSDGVGAITDIEAIVAHPGDTSARKDLHSRERLLASDRAAADAELHRASVDLGGVDLGSLGLPALPSSVS